MDIKKALECCWDRLHLCRVLFEQKKEENALKHQLTKAKEQIEEMLTDNAAKDSVNLSKFFSAVRSGLDRAIQQGPYQYFETNDDLINLLNAFTHVYRRINVDLSEEDYNQTWEYLSVPFPDILDEMTKAEILNEIPRDYAIKLLLESGAILRIRMFNASEHAWTFAYYYYDREEGKWGENPTLINDLTLYVKYIDGVSDECNLSMNIIVPDRLKDQYLEGGANSPDAKLFLEFIYEKIGEGDGVKYKLARVETMKGGRLQVLDLQNVKGGLMQPLEFPFLVPDEIVCDFGEFRVQFQKNDGTDSAFVFPEDIRFISMLPEAKHSVQE